MLVVVGACWLLTGLGHALGGSGSALAWTRLGIDATALLACLMALQIPGPVALWCASSGLGSLFGLMAVTTVFLFTGSQHAGTGYVNSFLAVVVPPMTAWFAWLGMRAVQGERPGGRLSVAMAGLVLLIVWCLYAYPGVPRRGALLALGAGLGAAVAVYVWQQRRSWVIAVVAVLVAIGFWWAYRTLTDASFLYGRGLRFLHWQAAMDGIRAWWPWGGGAWAAFHFPLLDSDAFRWALIVGEPVDHVHNEFLSAVLEYGLAGGLLCLAAIVLVVRAACRITDPARKAAAFALLASFAVLLAVDPAWGLPLPRIWMGVLVGLVLLLARESDVSPPPQRRLTHQVAVAVLLGLALLPVIAELPAALLRQDAGPTQILRALQSTTTPQVAEALLIQAEESPMPNMSGMGDEITAAAWQRLGPGAPIVERRLKVLNFLGSAQLQLEQPGAASRVAPAVLETHRQERTQLLTNWTQTALLVAHMYPFRLAPYLDLRRLQRAGCPPAMIPPRVARRIAWLMADADAEVPQLDMPLVGLEDAADFWAACRWWTARRPGDQAIHPALARLLDRFAPALSDPQPFIDNLARDPRRAARWAWRFHLQLAGICSRCPEEGLALCLEKIRTRAAARVVYALLCRNYQPVVEEEDTGRRPVKSRAQVVQHQSLLTQEERLRRLACEPP